MKTYLLLASLLVFGCADEEESNDNGADATAAEAPEVWIEAGQGLPTGESSVNSLSVTVSGNKLAVSYQYALFSDDKVTCADATYGEFQELSSKLVVSDLGANGTKIICLRGKDKDGNVQAQPKRYSWTKVAGAAADEQTPEALLESIPTPSTIAISSKVIAGNTITVKYQYALINAKDYDCAKIESDENVSYGAVVAIDQPLEQELGNDGHKTLCLRGLDKDDRLQNKATPYTWVKSPPPPHEDNEKPAEGKAGIGLIKQPITFTSGTVHAESITVQNVGVGKLKWHAKTANDVDWLQIKSSDDSFVAIEKGKLASGEIDTKTFAIVSFKLTKGEDTDYGKPYKREHEIVFVNEESGYEIKETIKLNIPQLDTKREWVNLTRNSDPVKVYAKNKGEGDMYIQVVGAFPTNANLTRDNMRDMIANLKEVVSYRTGMETEGVNKDKRYVEFSVTDTGKDSCKAVRQMMIVYSNGDSKGVNNCNIMAGTKYIGREKEENAKWTTNNCKRIVVTFAPFGTGKSLDLNDDKVVNILDLTFISTRVGKDPSEMNNKERVNYKRADIDGNGKVEQADLTAISKCFGKTL